MPALGPAVSHQMVKSSGANGCAVDVQHLAKLQSRQKRISRTAAFEFLRGGDAEVLAVRNEGSVSGSSYHCFETYILLREMLSVSNHLL